MDEGWRSPTAATARLAAAHVKLAKLVRSLEFAEIVSAAEVSELWLRIRQAQAEKIAALDQWYADR